MKNLIILDKVVKYNTKYLNNEGTVKVPDYIINDCINNNKTLIITHKHEKISEYKPEEIILNISTVDRKPLKGTIKGKEVTFFNTIMVLNM